MRPFEILIPATLLLYTLLPLFTSRQNPPPLTFLPILAIALICIHLLVEGYRWQMVPLYALSGVIFLITVFQFFHPATGGFNRLSWAAAGLAATSLLLAASAALPALLPVPSIPVPSGPYQVGTRTWLLVDDSRRELFSGADEPRKFMVQFWYPADPGADDRRAPWVSDAKIFGRAISNYIGMPEFFLDHLSLSESPAWQDGRLYPVEGGYPIIVFSHGWNGFAAQNTGQAVELASHGYVVVALQHTFGAVVTVFPDGEIDYNNPTALPKGAPDHEYDAAARLLADQWAGDIRYTLDVMGNMAMDVRGSFWGAFDFNRIGVYGHSTGGGAAIQFCATDMRCKALLTMDPFMTPVSEQVLDRGIPQPAFFMFSQLWVDDVDSKNNRLFSQFYSHLSQSFGVIGIQGTAHYDFTDLPMLTPIAPQLGLKGPLDGKHVTEIVNSYLLSFFEATLKGQPSEQFAGPSKYPEVINLR